MPRYFDNISYVAWCMNFERRLAAGSIHKYNVGPETGRDDVHAAMYAPHEIEELFASDRLSFVNMSEDTGIFETINRPDIYGFYRTSEKYDYHMTLEEVGNRINRYDLTSRL